ncbi:hypothetical protein HGH93_09635 [Chitinophaga polysaccharea]|uniref:hypothetical protein n=1 Tax=Chitinophaga TaxID=79328 RepID=UPI001455262E|nr:MULTISPECIES: hypothetical protein [Chitinophaga]NLR58359.1 hypothetical protein [Chitinophaga polysaccharea]NLU90886.1 hypothetical protein [Chitinophaga sp. Ak27]
MKKLKWSIIPVLAVLLLSSFTGDDESNPYGTCDKSNQNPCKITKYDGTVITNSTGAWIAP